jgi:hypothetical protein
MAHVEDVWGGERSVAVMLEHFFKVRPRARTFPRPQGEQGSIRNRRPRLRPYTVHRMPCVCSCTVRGSRHSELHGPTVMPSAAEMEQKQTSFPLHRYRSYDRRGPPSSSLIQQITTPVVSLLCILVSVLSLSVVTLFFPFKSVQFPPPRRRMRCRFTRAPSRDT